MNSLWKGKSSLNRVLKPGLPLKAGCWLISVILASVAISVLGDGTNSVPGKRPNILWLVSEDNTTLLGCYGDPIARTPTLDKLGHEGVIFTRCFANPVCAPSRFALITGTFAASSGPAHHMRAKGKIPSWMEGFPAYLRRVGYYASNNAKTDYNCDIAPEATWDESSRTAHYKNRRAHDQPFFAVFNHEITHESCLFPEKDVTLGFEPTNPAKVHLPPYQPDTPEIRADWARHYDHMALLDTQIAARLKELREEGLADDTIVFYYADNGGATPRSKRFLHTSGTLVPLIVYFPPKWRHLAPAPPGSRINTPVSFVDFAPTILSLAGVPIPKYMQGKPFAGPRPETNQFAFCTRDRMDERYDMMRSLTDGRWLYIRNFRPDLPYVQPIEYMFQARGYQSWAREARSGKLTRTTAQFWGQKPAEELYDLEKDPHNTRNLADNPEYQTVLGRMREALRRHCIQIVDNGFLPEGSPLEGYEASRNPRAYPIEKVYDLAVAASERDPAKLRQFVAAMHDPCEAMRWWAAQGCAMLGKEAAPAESLLRTRLRDPSPSVRVAVAEALARIRRVDPALPTLEPPLEDISKPCSALQAANVLNRLRDTARPSLPVMKRVLDRLESSVGKDGMIEYLKCILAHTVGVLEGRVSPLVWAGNERPEQGAREQ
ncbi:MAG: sulfatase-like hydrolase/transferase [Verrucomicrobiae bacterium]|nr:sulfatase-like hydrolase/transferase [Verrucomicrobiae bacterium]